MLMRWNDFQSKPLTQIYLSSFQDDFLIQVFEEIGPITTPGSQAKHLISCIVPIIIQTKIRLFQLWTFDYNMIFLIHT